MTDDIEIQHQPRPKRDPEQRVPFLREKITPKHKARLAGRGTREGLRHDQFKEKCGKRNRGRMLDRRFRTRSLSRYSPSVRRHGNRLAGKSAAGRR